LRQIRYRVSPYTPTLLFVDWPREGVAEAERNGLRPQGGAEALFLRDEPGTLLDNESVTIAITTAALANVEAVDGVVRIAEVPREAILNLGPYRPLREVVAAGGIVTRRAQRGTEVVLIHRRGRWDLPKGKLDEGEEIDACAVREVGEELGIDDIRLLGPLGRTVHGYDEGGAYRVKTVHWFHMTTPSKQFHPQADEDIDEVIWLPWFEALERVGYLSLRLHMLKITADLAR
jgi:8-oxo-dGTP pyrophosphatase MutT (NUDIX family)